MKKFKIRMVVKSFVFFDLMLAAFISQAQIRTLIKSVDEIEIVGGLSLVTLQGVKYPEYNRLKMEYSAGMASSWLLNSKLNFNIRLLVERKGIKRFYEGTYFDENSQPHHGEETANTDLDYITLQLAPRYFMERRKRLFLDAGLYVSYMYKAQQISDFSWKARSINNQMEYYRKMDAGLQATLGYKFLMEEKVSLACWANIGWGLIDISSQSSTSIFHDVKNRSITIGLSIFFKKSR